MQPLGVHMNGGGGVGRLHRHRDEERYAREYPTLQVSIADTSSRASRRSAMTLFEQTSYGSRENGNDWTGNSVYLWAIANAAYMALMGPAGFARHRHLILQRSHYAARRLAPSAASRCGSTSASSRSSSSTSRDRKTVAEINAALRERGIFGGKDLSPTSPSSASRALYCVTEIHTQDDIDRLADALRRGGGPMTGSTKLRRYHAAGLGRAARHGAGRGRAAAAS